MSASRYIYKPLDGNQSVMRTMRLKRASAECEPVQCELDITMLNDGEERGGPGVSYEALSYTWGDTSAAPQHILVNGGVLPVTANLHCALVHLRQSKHDRVLWIDAICIDQENHRERTHQVDLMKRIYGQAERVLIWLGPATFKTRIAMPYLLQVDQAVRQSGRRLDMPDAWRDEFERSGQGSTAAAMAHPMLPALFESPWFRRIWVIQEAASAKAALVMYGHDAVPARTFAMLSTLPSVHIPEGAKAALEVMPSPLKKMSWWRDSRDLLTLLCKFTNYEATDPRDKVYALLGISETGDGESRIKPDYSVTETGIRRQVNKLIASHLSPKPIMLDRGEAYDQISYYSDRLPGSVDQIAASVIHWAVKNGRPSLVTDLIRGTPDLNPNVMFEGNTLLNLAMSTREVYMIEALAACGDVDIWSVGTDGLYPLQAAMLCGLSTEPAETAAAEAFIKHNRIWENEGAMGLIADTFPKMLERIEECRLRIYSRQLRMYSHRLWEEINCEQENIKLIEHYIDEGADVNYLPEAEQSIDLLTPLGVAAKKGSMATAEVLLKRGADPGRSPLRRNFTSPLLAAAAAGHTDVVRLLLDAGARNTYKALQIATTNGHAGTARLIKEKRRHQTGSLEMFRTLRGYSP
ncbi:hypothetical protein RB595_006981 [Gaeumannomyces hyphopodioides]